MKKRMGLFLVTLLCCLSLIGAAFAAESPSVTLDVGKAVVREVTDAQTPAAIRLFKGSKQKLTALLQNADGQKIQKNTWTSSDTAIATVSSGTVTAKAAGEAVITCESKLADGTMLTASVRVIVEIPVASIVPESKAMTVRVGETLPAVGFTVKPAEATCQTITWTSSDTDVMTVDAQGRLTGIKAGKAVLTLQSSEDSAAPKKTVVNVTVIQPVASISLDVTECEIVKGKTKKLTPTLSPEDASSKKRTWASSDTTVATVADGVVTAKGAGTAVITCTAADGSGTSASCTVEVVAPVTAVAFPSKTASVPITKESLQLSVTVSPENAKYKSVTWSSADESIATVDANGLVTPHKVGKVVITATSADPSTASPKKATCTVQVVEPVKTVLITSGGSIRVAVGKTQKITTKVGPDTATDKSLVWKSSNEKVAMVSAGGTVTAKGLGTAKITCTTADGSEVSAFCDVTVYKPVSSIKMDSSRLVLTEGETGYASATVSPKDATSKKINWTSDETWVASVDRITGQVTAKSAGKCTLTATAADGSGKKAKLQVIVEPEIPLDATTFTRSGYFGYYYEFAVTFKNLTQTRRITYLSFDLKYTYAGSTYTVTDFYDDSCSLSAHSTKKIGWWDQIGYKLSYCSNFRIYLRSVKYADGTWDYFPSDTLIGWFN